MNLRVECYSGRKADERPVRFYRDDRVFTVRQVLDQWYGPDAAFFKVRADDGNVYVLSHTTGGGLWRLELFERRGPA